MADTSTDNSDKLWDLGADHTNLLVLLGYLQECGATTEELLDACEKPWHYNDELVEALADLASDDSDTAEDFSPEAGHHDPDSESAD